MNLRVQLKVCEGCGCLWYRTQNDNSGGTKQVYCASCAKRLTDFPPPQTRARRGRPRKLAVPTLLAVAEVAGGAR